MAVSKLLILRSRVDRFRLDNAGIFLNLTIPAEGYTIWLAGGGVRGGLAYGETDEYEGRDNRLTDVGGQNNLAPRLVRGCPRSRSIP